MPTETETEMTVIERKLDLAKQMVAHMDAHQDPAYQVTGKLWSKGDCVRIYLNVGRDTFVEITEQDGEFNYRHEGRDRGSLTATRSAWNAAE